MRWDERNEGWCRGGVCRRQTMDENSYLSFSFLPVLVQPYSVGCSLTSRGCVTRKKNNTTQRKKGNICLLLVVNFKSGGHGQIAGMHGHWLVGHWTAAGPAGLRWIAVGWPALAWLALLAWLAALCMLCSGRWWMPCCCANRHLKKKSVEKFWKNKKHISKMARAWARLLLACIQKERHVHPRTQLRPKSNHYLVHWCIMES